MAIQYGPFFTEELFRLGRNVFFLVNRVAVKGDFNR